VSCQWYNLQWKSLVWTTLLSAVVSSLWGLEYWWY